jgi:outer membrane protein assembly factor BamB
MILRVTIFVSMLSFALIAIDWPQWRGPQRDGHSAEKGLLKSWPESGPRLVWKAQGLGEGYSSFAVANGRLYTQGQRGGSEYLMAFDIATGNKVWETPNGPNYQDRRGNGPRGAPTVEGTRVYAVSANGSLLVAEAATGRRVWSVSFLSEYGGSVPRWGYSESPLIDGDRLIVQPGGKGSSVVALNKNDGRLIWKSQSDGAAYSSALAVGAGKSRTILHLTHDGAVGLRADNGELLWRYTKVANRTANVATPIYRDGFAFFSTDYGTGAALLKLDAAGANANEVYFTRDMRNHYSSSVLVGDYLYGFSSAILTAMKFQTGEVAWRDRSVGKGSVIYADGHLYCQGEDGVIALVEASPEAYKEKSRFTLGRGGYPLWTLPVISNGRLYVRDQDTLYNFQVGTK